MPQPEHSHAPTRRKPSATWPLWQIVDVVKRTGALPKPELAALQALTTLLDHRSGSGRATVAQVADVQSYTARRMGDLLAMLEQRRAARHAPAVLTWSRGLVVKGRPIPSTFRVSKLALLALADAALSAMLARRAQRRIETRARIAGLKTETVKARRRRSALPEKSSDLLPKSEVTGAHAPPSSTADGTEGLGQSESRHDAAAPRSPVSGAARHAQPLGDPPGGDDPLSNAARARAALWAAADRADLVDRGSSAARAVRRARAERRAQSAGEVGGPTVTTA